VGQVSGAKIKSSAGGTDIDVIGPNGELIMVGDQRKQMILVNWVKLLRYIKMKQP